MNRFAQQNKENIRRNRFGSSGGNQYDIEGVERSIDNAQTRISAAGFEPTEDKRNWFEKATNLPEGQNFFFDALELIDRPGNAIRNAIDKKGNNGQELWRGFSGQDKTRGTDILDDIGLGGVQNKYAKGILGFGAEVLTDPTMLIPGGAIVKGVGKGAKLGATATKGAYNVLAPNAVKQALEPALKGTKESLGYMFNPSYGRNQRFNNGRLVEGDDVLTPMIQRTKNNINYQNTKNMDNIIKTAKNAGGYQQGNLVGRVMEDGLEQFDRQAVYKLPDGRIVEKPKDVWREQQAVRRNRNQKAQSYEDLYTRSKEHYNQRNIDLRNQLEQVNNQIRDIYFGYEKDFLRRAGDTQNNAIKGLKNELRSYDRLAPKVQYNPTSVMGNVLERFNINNPSLQQVDNAIAQLQDAYKLAEDDFVTNNIKKYEADIAKYVGQLDLWNNLRNVGEEYKRIKDMFPSGIYVPKGNREDWFKLIPKAFRASKNNSEVTDIFKAADDLGFETVDDLIVYLQNITEDWKALQGRKGDIVDKSLNHNLEVIEERLRQQYRQSDEGSGLLSSVQDFVKAKGTVTRESFYNARNTLRKQLNRMTNNKTKQGMKDYAINQSFAKLVDDPGYKQLTQQQKQLEKAIRENLSRQKDRLNIIRENKLRQVNTLDNTYNQLDKLRQQPNTVKETLIPREKLPMPDNPAIRQAAGELMRSNDTIRNQAKALGIPISELQGYMRHILSKEEKARRKLQGSSVYDVDRGNFGIGNPNDKFLQQRKYTGSVEEINRREDRTVFEPNAFFSTAYGQKQLTEYMHAVDFRRKVLSDPSLAIKYQKGMNVPEGAVKINTKNYQFMKDEDLAAMGLLDEVGGEYIVPKAVKSALDQFQRLTTDDGIKGFLQGFDKAQSWWKRMALFSLPYHVRNDIGAKFNNYVGGMNAADIARYSAQADAEVYQAMVLGKPNQMYDEYLQQGLGASSQSRVEFALRGDDAAKELERLIKEQSKTGASKALGKVLRPFETSRQFGDFVDQTNRYAMYKWARSKGMNAEQAAAKVRQTQFDYTNLTNFEREFMTRLVPFYRWMRNNIPYQIRQFANDPRKFVRVDDFRRNAQSAMGINEENIPEWMTEQFAIPVSGNEDGSGQFLSMNLPVGDLTRVSQPGKTMVDSLTPLAKLPVELTMNRNFFYNSPIESYEGQQEQFNVPLTDIEFGIPKRPAYALENLTGQIGRNTFNALQQPEQQDQNNKFTAPSLGISSMMKDYDIVKSEYYQKLQELQALQDRINYIEQQTGMRPPTMNEINSSQNRSRNRFSAIQQ